jgi:hypothetical protein
MGKKYPPWLPWCLKDCTFINKLTTLADGVKVARSSGYSVLDRSAPSSARPIETWVQVPMRFKLH